MSSQFFKLFSKNNSAYNVQNLKTVNTALQNVNSLLKLKYFCQWPSSVNLNALRTFIVFFWNQRYPKSHLVWNVEIHRIIWATTWKKRTMNTRTTKFQARPMPSYQTFCCLHKIYRHKISFKERAGDLDPMTADHAHFIVQCSKLKPKLRRRFLWNGSS